ncbi:MAG: DNA cytosine methyltransferase [Methanobrevibacter sp.]|nr:DNA cytosine methyltransferase [Methanobrevibacter sp.]
MQSGETEYRIRKLTPRECWRLMDFTDEDFDKAQVVNSNTQLYKQAGNSIVVNGLVAILGQLFEGKEDVYKKIVDKEFPYKEKYND